MLNAKSYFERVASVKEHLESMRTHWKRTQAGDYLGELLRGPFLSAQMNQFQERIMEQFAPVVLNYPELEDTIRTWKEKTAEEKLRILRGFQIVFAGLQSQCGIEVRPVPLSQLHEKQNRGRACGYPDEPSAALDRILLNMDLGLPFATNLGTMMHEQTHILQFAMARAVEFDHIDPSHPLYGDAQIFHAIYWTDSYIDSNVSEKLYRAQPAEVHARDLQTKIMKEIGLREDPREKALRSATLAPFFPSPLTPPAWH
jgi:hypothetical protein